MQLAFKTMMSAEMRRTVALQVHRGLTGLVESGKNAGGLSFGYEITRDERGDRITGELCVVGSRAEIVRRIMTKFADGSTARQIAYDLNRDSIPSPSGGAWRQNTILGNSQRGTGILNNELYMGVRVWNRLEYRLHPTTQKRVSRPRPMEQWVYCDVPHLKIVEDALWDRVKRRQMSVRRNHDDRNGHEGKRPLSRRSKFLLSGLLFCKCCGGKLTIAETGERRYYYCQTAKQQGPSSCVGMTGLRQLDAEVVVLSGLKKDLMKPAAFEAFRQDYAAALKESVKGLGAEKEGFERSLKKLEKQIGNATSAILGGLNSPALLEELRKAEEQKADLVERLARVDLPEPDLPENLDTLYAERVRDLEATIAHPKLIQQAIDVMKLLVERIVVEERPQKRSYARSARQSGADAHSIRTRPSMVERCIFEKFAEFGCGSSLTEILAFVCYCKTSSRSPNECLAIASPHSFCRQWGRKD